MKHLIVSFLILFPLTGFAADSPPAAETRPVGAAAVDITPDYPVRLSGYGGSREREQGRGAAPVCQSAGDWQR